MHIAGSRLTFISNTSWISYDSSSTILYSSCDLVFVSGKLYFLDSILLMAACSAPLFIVVVIMNTPSTTPAACNLDTGQFCQKGGEDRSFRHVSHHNPQNYQRVANLRLRVN